MQRRPDFSLLELAPWNDLCSTYATLSRSLFASLLPLISALPTCSLSLKFELNPLQKTAMLNLCLLPSARLPNCCQRSCASYGTNDVRHSSLRGDSDTFQIPPYHFAFCLVFLAFWTTACPVPPCPCAFCFSRLS